MHSLIQEQQATLQALLEGQQAIQEKQLALEQKVCDLEKTQPAVSQSTTTTLKTKKLVPSHLSVSHCNFNMYMDIVMVMQATTLRKITYIPVKP